MDPTAYPDPQHGECVCVCVEMEDEVEVICGKNEGARSHDFPGYDSTLHLALRLLTRVSVVRWIELQSLGRWVTGARGVTRWRGDIKDPLWLWRPLSLKAITESTAVCKSKMGYLENLPGMWCEHRGRLSPLESNNQLWHMWRAWVSRFSLQKQPNNLAKRASLGCGGCRTWVFVFKASGRNESGREGEGEGERKKKKFCRHINPVGCGHHCRRERVLTISSLSFSTGLLFLFFHPNITLEPLRFS